MIEIIIPGEPIAKGRPKFSAHGGFARAYTPAKTVKVESTIALFASQAMVGRELMKGPISVELLAYRAKGMPGNPNAKQGTKSARQWADAESGIIVPVTKPDLDNTIKLLDALNGIVWVDDAQVVVLSAKKLFSTRPRLEIRIQQAIL